MAFEQKENSGALFKNDKRTQDTHAHARGSALIDGVEYFVDAWTNIDKKGDRYQSLKFKRKDKQPQRQSEQPGMSAYASKADREADRSSYGTILDDDVPFAPEFR